MGPIDASAEARLRDDVREFTSAEMARLGSPQQCDSWMIGHSREFSRALAARGWVGMTLPRRYGGHERSSIERYVVVEELLAAGAPVAAHWFADRQVGPALVKHGTEEQRDRFLPAICRGELCVAIGMSEPDSGSDLASVRTRATWTGDSWRLTGAKVWTSHAHVADLMLVLARTEPRDSADRHAGLSQLLVELPADGVQINPIVTMDGQHHFNEVVFDDLELPAGAVLGVPGRGWQQVTQELAWERSGPERFLSTMPLLRAVLRSPEVSSAAELGTLVAEIHGLRVLSRQVAVALDHGEVPTLQSALVKDLGTRLERRVVEVARRLAPIRPDPDSANDVARLLGEAILHSPDRTLRGGTNEVLRGIVSRTLVAS